MSREFDHGATGKMHRDDCRRRPYNRCEFPLRIVP